MNIKAIIASLVLGSSTVTMADPSVTFSASAEGRVGATTVRDHRTVEQEPGIDYRYRDYDRYGDPYGEPAPVRDRTDRRGGWASKDVISPSYRRVVLARGLSFGGDGREFISVGADFGRFRSLQISAAGGRTFIKQVYVQFENGEEQVVRELDATLTGSETLRLDLHGGRRAIRRIVVYGTDLNGGWRRHSAAFTVTAV